MRGSRGRVILNLVPKMKLPTLAALIVLLAASATTAAAKVPSPPCVRGDPIGSPPYREAFFLLASSCRTNAILVG